MGTTVATGARAALDGFLLSLRAKDASEHTLRSYDTGVGEYLEWLGERGADWRAPSRTDLRAYLAKLVGSGARSSVSQRLAAIRSFHRFAATVRLLHAAKHHMHVDLLIDGKEIDHAKVDLFPDLR